ncbi:hypothetical protein [Spirochaeta cellobiosiphila]|uniref:hypothetical protein n=1 Tax=Spirochaeta cellobiosiphila TaxID=504483 RepID=UPI0012EB3556|nr:hypothetical protein [Spirochaeta cellobiosiphila]
MFAIIFQAVLFPFNTIKAENAVIKLLDIYKISEYKINSNLTNKKVDFYLSINDEKDIQSIESDIREIADRYYRGFESEIIVLTHHSSFTTNKPEGTFFRFVSKYEIDSKLRMNNLENIKYYIFTSEIESQTKVTFSTSEEVPPSVLDEIYLILRNYE